MEETNERIKYPYRLKKIARLANSREGTILDIGFSLLPNPYLRGEVIGLDIVLPEETPKNYKKMIKANVMKKLPFKNNSVDTIVLGGVIEHLENPILALREMNRVLKEDGVLLMETPNPYFFPIIFFDWVMHLKYYFEDTHVTIFPRRVMLKNLWNTGFDLEKIEGCGFNLNDYQTLPLPEQFSQDIIYVAVKRTPENRYFKKVREMRKVKYDDVKV
jgi:SAM-dependent methyltransferase